MSVVAVSGLLIIRCTAEKRGIFYIYSSVVNSGVESVHKVCLSYEFGELKNYQQLDFIEEALNESCFKGFIVEVVMLDNNAQKLSGFDTAM